MSLTPKQIIGQIGENIAVKHLKKLGYKILDRNYRKKWGEIDIIAEKNESKSLFQRVFKAKKILHFIEVKSVSPRKATELPYWVSHETSYTSKAFQLKPVSIETLPMGNQKTFHMKRFKPAVSSRKATLLPYGVSHETMAPEENITSWKKKRLSRAIRTYLAEKKVSYETEFKIDVIAIFIDLNNKKAKIRFTENVII